MADNLNNNDNSTFNKNNSNKIHVKINKVIFFNKRLYKYNDYSFFFRLNKSIN